MLECEEEIIKINWEIKYKKKVILCVECHE